MKLSILSTFLTSLLFIGCSNGQTNDNPIAVAQQNKTMENFEYSFKSAHPKAQTLMRDEFYWSPIEETAPFGSDDGSDAAYGFRQWRFLNKTSSPVTYLKDLIASWQYPPFDYNEMDTAKIKEYIFSKANPDETAIQQQMQMLKDAFKNSADTSMNNLDDKQLRDLINSTSKEMGGSYLLGQDNAIIGTGFAQFVLEGHIDNDIKALTITAIKRQLLPLLISRYDDNYRDKRKQQLTKMLEVINKATL
jgi:uncharacterized protein YfeS